MNDYQNEPVIIKSYDATWPSKFKNEQQLIQETLGSWIIDGPHHFGSTSIPNLPAKPIIDILVGVKDLKRAEQCISLLEGIGYCYYPYRPYMHWFCKPSPSKREFHVQIMETTHPEYKEKLIFRDYLRAHPELAKDYAKLKESLSVKFRNDREAYTDAKTTFVHSIIDKASS